MGQNAIYYKGKSYTGGGGGGSSTLVDLTDVNIDSPLEGQGLVYDATNQKWVNGDVGGGTSTYKETVLWEGCTNSGSYTLDTPITNFDAVIAYGLGYMGSNLANSNLIIPVFISVATIKYNMQYMANGSWTSERRAYIIFTDATHFSLGINGSNAGFYKLTGVNFGGGVGSTKIVDELWNGNEQPPTTGTSINLAHSISDYDLIAFSVNNTTAYESNLIVSVDELETGKTYIQAGYYNTCAFFTYTSDTEILIMSAASSDRTNYTKIEGIKYGSSGGGSSEVNYSTTEQKIGKWIDGSDLYQITYSYTSAITSIDISSLNVNEVIDLTGTYLSGSSWVPITRTSDNLNYQSAIWASSTTLQMWFGSSVPSVSKLYVTIKYTKTSS